MTLVDFAKQIILIGNYKGIFGNMAKSLDEWIGVSSYNEIALY